MKYKILIWDNDGTITGSKDPNDTANSAKIILPNVRETMEKANYNFVISGFKSPESEAQNFDPEKVAAKFIDLMRQLPINAAAFSPAIGGVACYIVLKKQNGKIEIIKIHENSKYHKFIGEFKKPGIGMFEAIRDIALEEFDQNITPDSSVMISDTWHDKKAAEDFGINFIDASEIHQVNQCIVD